MSLSAPLESGRLITTAIAAPAANSIFTYTPSERLIEQIYSITYILDTDSNAANRRYFFQLRLSGDTILTIATQNNDIADRVNTHNWIVGAESFTDVTATPNQIFQSRLPPGLYIPLGGSLRLVIVNGQVGDQLSDIFVTTKTWARV